MAQTRVIVDGEVRLNIAVDGDTSFDLRSNGEVGIITKVKERDAPPYTGNVTVTPSRETQTLATANKILLTNITINPIPSNYGLITWDGSTLTVS